MTTESPDGAMFMRDDCDDARLIDRGAANLPQITRPIQVLITRRVTTAARVP